MSGLVESATAVMRMASQRLDIVSHNVSNISTSGYKRKISFVENLRSNSVSSPIIRKFDITAQGSLTKTGNPTDLAISGDGYFRVRMGSETLYSRQGVFTKNTDGNLVSPQGYILQQVGGGDLVLGNSIPVITPDGTLLDDGRPIARIAIERPTNAAAFVAVGESFYRMADGGMEDVPGAIIRQGMLESSNVTLGDEMTASMLALREAESGARLIQVYDDLMGRALSTFGQGGR